MISGRITNPEQANKYFEKVNEVVVKGCGATTLTVDTDTDIREDMMVHLPFFLNSQANNRQQIVMKVLIKKLFP